jgi:hypothetical protein
VRLTPGQIIALSGDLYAGPAEIAAAASMPRTEGGAPPELDQLLSAIEQERAGRLTDANQTYDQITGGRLLRFARRNETHFAPLNRTEWRRLHDLALSEAAGTRDDASLQHALLVDAAAGHFLTDAYASGHLINRGELLAAIRQYLSTHPVQTPNPEVQTYAGIVTLHGDMPELLLKNIHDRLNVEGFDVTNARGMSWRTFGDNHLARAPDTRRIASLAIFLSRQQIYAARRGDSPDPAEVEALMPDDATIARATAQAIAYIPAAAAGVQSLMYRARGLAGAQFPGPLGPIITSNLATIASPGRERQLLELERASRSGNTGPLLAPQLTLLTWE